MHLRRLHPRLLVAFVAVAGLLLASNLTAISAGDLQSRISAEQAATAALRSQVAADTARIGTTSAGLAQARTHLATLQSELSTRAAQLRRVQSSLLRARNHLVDVENRLGAAASALAVNLRDSYENGQPSLVSAVVDANGFSDLLERVDFLKRIATQDAHVLGAMRTARIAVRHQVGVLGVLEDRDRKLTGEVLTQRNQVAALSTALLDRQIAEIRNRSGDGAKLGAASASLHRLQAEAAAQAARAAAQAARAAQTGNAVVAGGVAVDTGGMVQAPAGAPEAVRQVIAAANAIATLPYVYGGGHASFHANGYDCSGSVSYALAAAGLVSSPLDSSAFETWGEPGPGRWITVYANAGHAWMEVAGWRFDTVALSEGGTRWARGGGEFGGFVVRHPAGL
jgi:peptidoglycan hydrolase CwlO-like protein